MKDPKFLSCPHASSSLRQATQTPGGDRARVHKTIRKRDWLSEDQRDFDQLKPETTKSGES